MSYLAAMEANLYPREEPDAARTGRTPGLEVSDKWTRAWWNAGASHMHAAFPKSYFDRCGLLSLLDQRLRFQLDFMNRRIRNRTYGGVGGRRG